MSKNTYVAVGVALVVVLGLGAYGVFANPSLLLDGQGDLTACTQEAKVCPDGSAVGRTGPNCEFAACPDENQSVGMRVCPEAWYSNQMPGTVGDNNPPREYMVINGTRVELTEVDVVWVRANCVVNAPEPVF